MIGNTFVINAIAHAYNLTDANCVGETGRQVRDAFYGIHTRYNPPPARLPREAFCTDQSAELLARTHFAESPVDLLVYHALRLDSLFADGLCSLAKAVEPTSHWPERVVTYLGLDPTLGLDVALKELDEQHAALPAAVGVKLYPDQLAPYRTFRMDDPALMFPLYQRIAELGLRVVAVHKALPNGPVPLAPYRVDDVEGAAMHSPELNFEIVHAGMAFTTETALAIARFPNVYANLEVTTLLLALAPRLFAETMAELLYWAGPGKLLYSDGALFAHPAHIAERFASFTLPDDLLEKYGIEQLTDADRAGILGGNYAAMIGLDMDAAAKRQAGDEWSRRRDERGPDAPFTAWRELAGAGRLVQDRPWRDRRVPGQPAVPEITPVPEDLPTPAITLADIERVLSRVHDPCSLATGFPVPITDLGLVTGWSNNGDGTLRVCITATGAGCTFLGKIADAARAELLTLDGVHDARIELDTRTVWEPVMMDPAAREALGRRRTALAAGVIPYARRAAVRRNDLVPLWYHAVMAMNLRLDDEDSALLRALAEAEHVSLHEAALRAIRRSARELAHTDRVREATAEMVGRWGEVLDRLGRA